MKFDIGDVSTYSGDDLIILIGCPGSRWSQVHRVMSEHPDVNNTDWSDENSWSALGRDIHDNVINIGVHRGVYWGPGNTHGKNFERMDALSKEEILSEFMSPYDNWSGLKIVKSHWFAYSMDYLCNLFPKAKIVSCYTTDVESFFWWHKNGGWGLGYANYAWYENDDRLFQKIKEENANILKFNTDRDLTFKTTTAKKLWKKLKVPYIEKGESVIMCKVAVHVDRPISNFTFLGRVL